MGVYNRFGSKEALIAAVLVRGFDELRAAVAGDADPDPVDRLMSSGRDYRRFALARPQHYKAMFGIRLKAAGGTPELAEHAAPAFEGLGEDVPHATAAGGVREAAPRGTPPLVWRAGHSAGRLG